MLRPHAAVRGGTPPCPERERGWAPRPPPPTPPPCCWPSSGRPALCSGAGRPGGGMWEGASSCALGAQPPLRHGMRGPPSAPSKPSASHSSVNSSLKTTRGRSCSRVSPSDSSVCTVRAPSLRDSMVSVHRPARAPMPGGSEGPAGMAHTRAHRVHSRHPLPTGMHPAHTGPPPQPPAGSLGPGRPQLGCRKPHLHSHLPGPSARRLERPFIGGSGFGARLVPGEFFHRTF